MFVSAMWKIVFHSISWSLVFKVSKKFSFIKSSLLFTLVADFGSFDSLVTTFGDNRKCHSNYCGFHIQMNYAIWDDVICGSIAPRDHSCGLIYCRKQSILKSIIDEFC